MLWPAPSERLNLDVARWVGQSIQLQMRLQTTCRGLVLPEPLPLPFFKGMGKCISARHFPSG